MTGFVLSFGIAFAVSALAGLIIIPVLRKLKAGQSIREDAPERHKSKTGTPTVGGVIFMAGILAAILIQGADELKRGEPTHLYIFAFALIFGFIGFLDDLEKLRRKQNLGLSAGQKLLLQLAVAVAFVLLMRHSGNTTPNLYIPFVNKTLILPEPVYLVFAAFAIIAEVNAVNLTDGLDGLCAGVTLPVMLCFAAVAFVWNGSGGGARDFTAAGVFASASGGALLGFLLFNFHPAKVFMGDTGAQFLGGAVCALAFALDMPLILLVLGFIYLCETLSDVIQVTCFKITRKLRGTGRRVFKMAPVHHHLELSGWGEYRIFFTFTAVSVVCAAVSFLAVRGRWLI
ncbi:MAG: phospho-N-acetylmuramoyl-pentapeptide-transferase [Oscillospiraceae bacterium]|jgi:phospho-N-acetylmuramoyl-pentapeptide-transferase|nr:phospho-N-acetylmuramoyl-pentapeptide-transferase [Oscillospiraceae bacterium]